MTMLPAFSAVIPAFNEASRIDETLRLTLDYLRNASPESELIVVNDGSTDATSLIAREALEAAKIETRLLENFPNRGKGAAVRLGLLAAQKPIASMASPSTSSCFIWHNVPGYASAKFRCAGIMPRGARSISSTTACGCCGK